MAMADFAGILPLMVGVLLLGLSIWVWFAGRHRSYNLAFASLYFASGLKSLCEGIVPWAPRVAEAVPGFPSPLTWLYGANLIGLFLPPLLVLFVSDFPVRIPLFVRAPALRWALFGPSLVFGFLLFRPDLVAPDDLASMFNVVALTTVAAALVLLARDFAHVKDRVDRIRAGYMLGAFGVYFVLSCSVAFLQFAPGETAFFVFVWIAPFIELSVAGVTGYAIVKYQLLDIELKVKAGLKYSLTSGLVVVVFFVGNNTFQKVVEPLFAFTELSYLLAALTATLVFIPVQKGSAFLLNLLFPATVQPKTQYLTGRGLEIYHAQVNYVLRDGVVGEKERRFLDGMRRQLEIAEAEAMRIEHEVMSSLGATAGA